MKPEMKRYHPKKENKNTAWLVCSTPPHEHLFSCLPPKEFKTFDEPTKVLRQNLCEYLGPSDFGTKFPEGEHPTKKTFAAS
jgi:hypothetical protein